jgi:hypothetical protein
MLHAPMSFKGIGLYRVVQKPDNPLVSYGIFAYFFFLHIVQDDKHMMGRGGHISLSEP